MGASLAQAALDLGHKVTVVSGPVTIAYPPAVRRIDVITTEEMLDVTAGAFSIADGLIGAAAPCDYMPERVEQNKMSKTGSGLQLALVETPDIVATLASSRKAGQWVVGFALETKDIRFRAIVKMAKKCCDMMVSNSAGAMNSQENSVEVLLKDGSILGRIDGPKLDVARGIMAFIQSNLILKKT